MTLSRVSYDRGVHLRGTRLWVDAARRREVCVLTTLLDRLPPAHAQLIASTETAELLTRAGYAATLLPTPVGRWLGVGGVRLKLLDVGARPAGAAIYAALGNEHVLAAGPLRRTELDLPKADVLVAGVPALEHRGGSLAQAIDGVVAMGQAPARSARTVVVVECVEIGLALAAALSDAELPFNALGLLGKLTGGVDADHVPALTLTLARARLPSRARLVFIDTGLGEWHRARARFAIDATFRVRWFADAGRLVDVITETGARSVCLLGAHEATRPRVERLLGKSVEVRWLGEGRQLTLGAADSLTLEN